MSDNDKAPGWSVRRVISNGHRPRWAACEGERLVVMSESRNDVARIVEAFNGLADAAIYTRDVGAALGPYPASWDLVQAAQHVARQRDEMTRLLLRAVQQRNEALASLGAVRCERDELRAELAALRGAADTVWRVDHVTAPDGTKLWSVYDGDRLVMAAEDEAQARLVAAAPGCLRVAKGARPELATLREHAAVEHHGDPVPRIESIPAATPASTLTALTQAAERLTATLARHVELAQADAARLADAKRRTAALNRITAALRDASAEQVEALAGEIGARAPTLGTLSPLSWDVRIDGDRQAIEPLDASRAREDFGNWRAHLAVVHHAECADADKHGEPRPKPPTLELVVEVVVDRWEP